MKPRADRVVRKFLAEIVHPPRRLGKFMKSLIQKVETAASEVASAGDALVRLFRESPDYLQDFLQEAGLDIDHYDIEDVEKQAKKLQGEPRDWTNLVEYILAPDEPHRGKWVGYLINSLESQLDGFPLLFRVLDNLSDLDKRTAEQAASEWVDYVKDVDKAPALLLNMAKYGSQLRPVMEGAVVKLKELLRVLSVRTREELRPPSEDVETLYHASVNAAALLSKGFDPSGKHETEGLGGSQTGISFTSDLYIAKEIGRALKITAMIARGEVKAADVLRWSKVDGVLDDVKAAYASNVGGPMGDWNPEKTMALYEFYLAFNNAYNPVFMGNKKDLLRRLKGKNPRGIGVIEAKVDMSHPDIEYLSAEYEYRVPPEAVLSVDRILR